MSIIINDGRNPKLHFCLKIFAVLLGWSSKKISLNALKHPLNVMDCFLPMPLRMV